MDTKIEKIGILIIICVVVTGLLIFEKLKKKEVVVNKINEIKEIMEKENYGILDDYNKELKFAYSFLKSVEASKAVIDCGKNLAGFIEKPIEFTLAIICLESNFDSLAIGNSGEIGLMQLSPSAHPDIPKNLLWDEYVNICLGIEDLKKYFKKFRNWELVLIAYNRGPNNVKKYRNNDKYLQKFNSCINRVRKK